MTRLLRFHDDLVQKGRVLEVVLGFVCRIRGWGKTRIKAPWRNKIIKLGGARDLWMVLIRTMYQQKW